MEMRIYMVNPNRNNKGESVGAWFDLPVRMEEAKEKIGLQDETEECFIQAYDLPYDIEEETTIFRINYTYSGLQELKGTPVYNHLREIQAMWFGDIDELIDNADDIFWYSGIGSMAELARFFIQNDVPFDGMPSDSEGETDYEAIGRNMEKTGKYLVTSDCIFSYRDGVMG